MLREWGMVLHVDCHGTNISEELANFILSVVILDHPEDKDREILRKVYTASYPKRLKSTTAPRTKANLGR
jgi:hypothetical protein